MSTIEQQVTDAFNGKGWPAGKDGPSVIVDPAAELRRLRQELSLAEEGLANYQQEVNGLLIENSNLRGVRDQLLKDDGETIERLNKKCAATALPAYPAQLRQTLREILEELQLA